MTTPSQFRPAYETADKAYLLCADETGIVVFVSPTPENDLFSTPEGLSKSSTYGDAVEHGAAPAIRVRGWAYLSLLPSGWTAAFCVGSSCTDGELENSERVSFFYLDRTLKDGG